MIQEAPTIEAEGATLELVCEGDFPNPGTSDAENVSRFSVVASVQREIKRLVRKKLLQSIELKNYGVSKEIEWLEKFIALLNQQEANNRIGHQSAETWTPSDRQQKLADAEQRLQSLQMVAECGERESERADDVFDGQVDQIRIVLPNIPIDDGSFKLSNEAWRFVIGESVKLQKIQMIAEKIWSIEEKLEVEFWIAELKKLLVSLDEEKQNIAVGLIVELVFWKKLEPHEAAFSNVFNDLLGSVLLKEPLKNKSLDQFKNIATTNKGQFDVQLTVVELLAAVFAEIHDDAAFQEKFATLLCGEMTSVMEHRGFIPNHWGSVITILESFIPLLSPQMVDKFDRMFVLLEAQNRSAPLALRSRMTAALRYRKPNPSRPTHLPALSAVATDSRSAVRNFTVIEHSVTAEVGIHHPPVQRKEEEQAEWQRKVEEDIRRKLQEEFRLKEEMRLIEEQCKRQEELRNEQRRKSEEEEKRKEQEKIEQLQRDLQEAIRLQQEELRRSKEEAEQRRRAEEEQRRRQEEERRRQEEERRRKQAEEEGKRRQEEERRRKQEEEEEERKRKEKEEKRKRNEAKKCTFITNVALRLHTEPLKNFNERMLDGKIIGLLFSGFWCMPCQQFVPVLNEFYQQVEDDFEVLFISSDRNEAEMMVFMQMLHGNWFNLDFGSQLGQQLSTQLNVNSIPTLIIIKPNGNVITMNGVQEVENCRDADALIRQWKRV